MVQADKCFCGPLKNNKWSFGSAVRFRASTPSQSPSGRKYYATAITKTPTHGGETYRRMMAKTTNFGIGKRLSPGFYPEEVAKQRATVSPAEYYPEHAKKRSRSVTIKGRWPEPALDKRFAARMPGPGTYEVRTKPGAQSRDIRFGASSSTRGGSRPSSACSAAPSTMYNMSGFVVDGGRPKKNGSMASARFRGASIRDNDPILREKRKIPGPGTYNLSSCFDTPLPSSRSQRYRPQSAVSAVNIFYGRPKLTSRSHDARDARTLTRPRSCRGRLQSLAKDSPGKNADRRKRHDDEGDGMTAHERAVWQSRKEAEELGIIEDDGEDSR